MAEETWADSIPLPYPSVVYGALRSVYFANHIEKLNKANSNDDPTRELVIKNILLKIRKEGGYNIYYPLPLDLVEKKYKAREADEDKKIRERERRGKVYKIEKLQQGINMVITNKRTEKLLSYPEEVESTPQGYYLESFFKSYLKDKKARKCIRLSDFVEDEPKISIGREKNTHTTEEGKLYRVGMQRLKDIKIVVEFAGLDAGLDIPEKGLLRLGGEGKAAEYEEIEEIESIELPAIDDNLFKIYLATPAIFDNGWLPSWINGETLEGEIPETGNRVKLITAAIGKPLYVGGFNMKARRPKPMHRAVPQGSVYYFKIPRNGDRSNLERIHGQSISDKRKEEGFGICYIGNVKEAQE